MEDGDSFTTSVKYLNPKTGKHCVKLLFDRQDSKPNPTLQDVLIARDEAEKVENLA